ncbi:cupredoxin domain-containing protein [Puia sp.]|jgi:plastocyanin|uniref:cupredoxin domain-containing protein n=1 Tax=Puia sp. TaxID=2045100 RepID=UPI002F3EEC3E
MRDPAAASRRFLYLLCTLLFITACNSKPDQQPTAAPPKAPEPAVYTVEIKDMKFVPDSLVVKKGDEVIFVNRDMVAHCVTEVGKTWTSSAIPGGEDWMLVATRSATYYCAIHMVMKGKIIVQDSTGK